MRFLGVLGNDLFSSYLLVVFFLTHAARCSSCVWESEHIDAFALQIDTHDGPDTHFPLQVTRADPQDICAQDVAGNWLKSLECLRRSSWNNSISISVQKAAQGVHVDAKTVFVPLGAFSPLAAGFVFWLSRALCPGEPRSSVFLWLGSFSVAFFWGIDAGILSYFPAASTQFGLNVVSNGAVFAAGYFGPVLGLFFTQTLVGKIGHHGLMCGSGICIALASTLFGFVPQLAGSKSVVNFVADMILRALIGSCALTYQSSLFSLLSEMYVDDVVYAYGVVFMWVSLSALWSILCGEVYVNIDYAAANWVPACLASVFMAPVLGLATRLPHRYSSKEASALRVPMTMGVAKIFTVQCLPLMVWGYVVSTLEIELSVLFEKSSMRIVELSGLLIGWFMVAIAVTSLLVGNFCQLGCFGSYHRMFTMGQVLTAAGLLGLLVPKFLMLSDNKIFWMYIISLLFIAFFTRFTVVPGPKVFADVVVSEGGSAHAGLFFYNIAFTVGIGIGVLIGPHLVDVVGYRDATFVIIFLLLSSLPLGNDAFDSESKKLPAKKDATS